MDGEEEEGRRECWMRRKTGRDGGKLRGGS